MDWWEVVSFRRRTLYPGGVRGHIQKWFNFTRLQDSNGSIVRRGVLYPIELLAHVQKLFNCTAPADERSSNIRRRTLYPGEVRGIYRNDSILQGSGIRTVRFLGETPSLCFVMPSDYRLILRRFPCFGFLFRPQAHCKWVVFDETGHRTEGLAFGRTTAFEMGFPRSLHIARKMWIRDVSRLIELESEIHRKDQTTEGYK